MDSITNFFHFQVVSGGVACNEYLRHCLGIVCHEMGYTLITPPAKLCTDNGIMIAWNGMEKWKAQTGIAHDIDAVEIDGKYGPNFNFDSNLKFHWKNLYWDAISFN